MRDSKKDISTFWLSNSNCELIVFFKSTVRIQTPSAGVYSVLEVKDEVMTHVPVYDD